MSFDLGAIGWREALILAVAIVAAFAGAAVLRLALLARARPAAWKQNPAQFGEQQFMRGVAEELHELRGQMAALREEVERLKAARNISPQYGEAVALAQQGMDAQTIAERCGIAVAEAELVRALSRQAGQRREP